jgi:hypothetical protein
LLGPETGNTIGIKGVVMLLKFEVKKLTTRSPFGVKTAGKVGFTSAAVKCSNAHNMQCLEMVVKPQ